MKNKITGDLTFMILNWVNKSAQNKKGRKNKQGKIIFSLVPFYKWFGVSLLILSSLLIIFIPTEDKPVIIAFLFLFVFFGGGGLLLIIYYYRFNFEMDEEEIQYKGIINPSTSMKWEEIETIKFSVWSSCLVFKNKTGIKVRAHAHLQGISEIIEKIEKKKGLTKKDIKFPY